MDFVNIYTRGDDRTINALAVKGIGETSRALPHLIHVAIIGSLALPIRRGTLIPFLSHE